jgi:hypothetical protein
MADGSLKRWNHTSNQIEILLVSEAVEGGISSWPGRVGDIRAYRVSTEGHMVVASRLVNAEPPSYQVILLSLMENRSIILLESVPYLLDFDIAPNGRQLAYMVGDPNGDMNQYGPHSGSIYLLTIDDNQPAYAIGYCSNVTAASEHKGYGCNGLSWHPDSQLFVWADAQGLWRYDSSDSEIRLLQANRYDGGDIRVYRPLVWSPSGRYLHLDVGLWEGYREAVFDMETRQVLDIPHALFVNGRPPEFAVSWLQDDRLFVSWEQPDSGVAIEAWRIEPDERELALEDSYVLLTEPSNYPGSPTQFDNGKIGFVIFNFHNETNEQSGLYQLNSWHSEPQFITFLPGNQPFYRYEAVYWLPDGSGAIVTWDDELGFQHFTYIPTDEPSFYELRSELGFDVEAFSLTWVP